VRVKLRYYGKNTHWHLPVRITMDKHILCVSCPQGKAVKVARLNKTASELADTEYSWVSKAITKGVAPNGMELKPCVWHSGGWGEQCHTDPAPEFGVWFNDHSVIDTCHIEEAKAKKREDEESRKMNLLLRDINKWYGNADEIYEPFARELSKRDALLVQARALEKELKNALGGPDVKDQEYLLLCDKHKKAGELYNSRVVSLTKTYASHAKNSESLDDFIKRYASDEKMALVKAEEDMQRWYNNHASQDAIGLKAKVDALNNTVSTINASLTKNFTESRAYLRKALENLEKIDRFYSRLFSHQGIGLGVNGRPDFREDVLHLREMLGNYTEFL